MAKMLIKPAMFMIIITSLAGLFIISSCAVTTSTLEDGPNEGKLTALRRIFPDATDITEIPIDQDTRKSGCPDDIKISEIKSELGTLGYCVESKVTARSGPFRIRVLLDKQLYVKQATVISYPWSRGRDVCKNAFTSQFEGKGPEDPIRVDSDIDAITGATISSRAMAEGVRCSITLLTPRLTGGEKLKNKKIIQYYPDLLRF